MAFFSFLSVKKDDFEGWRCFVGVERGILQFFCADVHRKNLYVVKQKCTVTNCSYLF